MAGFDPQREIEIILKVAKGALINKAILVPIALLISAFAPSVVMPLLMIGGIYLCFEGVEKLHEKMFHHSPEVVEDNNSSEEEKIKGAIKTDFILSAEIIVIALGSIAGAPLISQIITLCIIALGMNVGVYGFVALLVKLDDIGLHLATKNNVVVKKFGLGLVYLMPYLMKLISVVGTVAMFLVGGGIISHGFHSLSHGIELLASKAPAVMQSPLALSLEALLGVLSGIVALLIVTGIKKLKRYI